MTGGMFRAGLIVPSSNTVVEDVWADLAAGMPGLRCHFTRLSVTEIHQDAATAAQFEKQRLLAAVDLLAELSPDSIVWAGTAGAWLGFERDRAVCAELEKRTGIPATSSLLVVNSVLEARGVSRIALVTPYQADTEAAIVANYEAEGFEVVSSARLDLTLNTDFAAVPPEKLLAIVEDLSETDAEAIVVLCTNLRGAALPTHGPVDKRRKVIDSVLETYLWLERRASS